MATTEELIEAIQARIDGIATIGYRIVVALTDSDETIMITDENGQAIVKAGGEEADAIVKVSSENLQKLMDGKLNPLIAYSTGRLKIEGSQSAALKLASLLQKES